MLIQVKQLSGVIAAAETGSDVICSSPPRQSAQGHPLLLKTKNTPNASCYISAGFNRRIFVLIFNSLKTLF